VSCHSHGGKAAKEKRGVQESLGGHNHWGRGHGREDTEQVPSEGPDVGETGVQKFRTEPDSPK